MSSTSPKVLSPLEGAVLIGQALCRDAYWDSEQRYCNWIGRAMTEVTQIDGPITPTTTALGPDLYGGSSGVALFLAQLFATTGDQACRRTAIGAIGRSLWQITRQPTLKHWPVLALFSGHLGVAYAAARIVPLTGQANLGDQIAAVLAQVAEAMTKPHVLDVIGGNAGAILALLSLSKIPAWRSYRAVAVALGEELCQTATREGNAWVWDAEKAGGEGMGTVLLTGFAHGAAGIGLALLELYAATGRTDFLEGGRAAFAYEDSLFNEEQGNWPDLRSYGAPASSPPSPRYAVAWCHGAPGIALARLRAASLDPLRRETNAAVADSALTTTRRAIEKARQLPRHDSTLCHGLVGLLEVLWIAAHLRDSDKYRAYVGSVAQELIQKHALVGDWPSGLPSGGPNPSLMLGTAGIGYQLLRLHDSQHIEPILIVSPDTSSWMNGKASRAIKKTGQSLRRQKNRITRKRGDYPPSSRKN